MMRAISSLRAVPDLFPGRAFGFLAMTMILASCSSSRATSEQQAGAAPAGDDTIECALGGAADFQRDCQVEETEVDGAKILVVHHPDGGFRRFTVLTDGRGLATAAGAEQAETSVADGRLDVSVGSDRYRFPATIRADDGTR
jgi:hypothetical protein